MSEHTPTPGPWRSMHVDEWTAIKVNQPASVCHVGDFVVATYQPHYEFHGSWEDDAQLIAAAPQMAEDNKRLRKLNTELIQALRALLKDSEDLTQANQWTEHLEQASAAIAKATGETDGK